MRVRTRSACVVLAWGILLLLTAFGSSGALRAAQANTRIASTNGNTSNTSSRTTTIRATLTSVTTTSTSGPASAWPPAAQPAARTTTAARAETPTRADTEARLDATARADTEARLDASARADTAAAAETATRADADAGRYVVQPGDTLSGIAASHHTPGGWPALYAANRRAVGPNPGLIRPGAVLALPGPAAPARYTVVTGDTLSGIAAALASPGGWPALYAANRPAIGPDPSSIRVGTVLDIPRQTPARPSPPAHHQATAGSPAPHPAPTPTPTPAKTPASAQPSASARSTAPAQATAPAAATRHPRPAQASPSAVAGLPRWLEIVLVAAGLLIGTAFLTEPTLAIARRRRATRPGVAGTRIVLADYDHLVVTLCGTDGTVCVLRPPGADPQAILLAARLVLAQDRYEELAGHLGVPAHWPRE